MEAEDSIIEARRIARERKEAQRLQPLLERIFPGIVSLIKETQSILKEMAVKDPREDSAALKERFVDLKLK
ncbi:MAG: hypothetical protein AAB873_03330, partial [Patescibacteria group bacterium]